MLKVVKYAHNLANQILGATKNTIQNKKYFEIKGTSWTNCRHWLCASPESLCAVEDVTSSLDSRSEVAHLESLSKPTVVATMAGTTSLEAVKRKIRLLQEKIDASEEKAERLQGELLVNKKNREQVSIFIKKKRIQSDWSCSCIVFL